ncbi:MAG: methionyl-tRNA formyltransferase [Nitrospirota bacterium]
MKILFMGTPEFALPSLEALAKQACLVSEYELIGVITQPDRPAGRHYKLTPPKVKELADKLNLKVLNLKVWQPVSLKEKEGLELVKGLKPDLIVVVAFGQILSNEFLQIPTIGSINLHASLLPKYRGASPISQAIIQGETKTGLTVAWINKELDAGDIILQQEVDIYPDDTAGTLSTKLSLIGADLLLKAIKLINEGKPPRIKQEISQVTYAPKLNKENGLIDWKKSAIEIHNLVRGLNPFPVAYTYYNEVHLKNQLLKIWETEIIIDEEGIPGEVVKILKDKGPLIGTGKGCLLIKQLQPANKNKLSGNEFIIGYRIKTGDIFGVLDSVLTNP